MKLSKNRRRLQLITTALLSLLVASCFATTDRLAVYDFCELSPSEVNELVGQYHSIEPNGSISALTFSAREEEWPHRRERLWPGTPPFFPQRAQSLAAATLKLTSITKFENGDIGVLHFEGVVVFSHIPGTDFILASMPGETLQARNEDGHLSPRSEENAGKNLFFVFHQSGKALTVKFFGEDDEGLKQTFGNPGLPLPTKKLLQYLRDNVQALFDEGDQTVLLRSTPTQQSQIEQQIETAFAKDNATNAAEGAAPAEEATVTATSPRPTTAPDASARPRLAPPSTKIESIDGFFLVGKDAILKYEVRNKAANGTYEYRAYLWARNWRTGAYQKGDFVERGYWYPDSQQLYHQGWFGTGVSCGDWSEGNWSYPFRFQRETLAGRTVESWYPTVLYTEPIPSGREKLNVCINRRVDTNTCQVLRCNERADPSNSGNSYLVRSQSDALFLSSHHFGN